MDVGLATTDASGVATLPGVALTGFDAALFDGAVEASFAGDATDSASSASGVLMVSPAPATLSLGGLVTTYDGTGQMAIVSTTPADLAGVSVTYTQNDLTVAAPTTAGSYTVTATLDNPNYTAPEVTGTLIINQATPTITWANPADIVYGTPLGPQQLDATSSLAGTFAYTQTAGIVLNAGAAQVLSGTFTPADTVDYSSVTTTVTINVLPGDADDHLGQSRGHRLRHALGPAAARRLGVHSGHVRLHAGRGHHPGRRGCTSAVGTFTPVDSTDYSSVTTTATINVLPATPVVTWTNPPAIVYGTPLGPAQLDATASTPGTFTYTPAAGTVLSAGAGQTLSVTFVPDDTADYAATPPPASSSTSCQRP